MKVLYSVYILLVIMFVTIFIYEHRAILTLTEQLCILALGLNTSLFISGLLAKETGEDNE